MTEVLAPTQHPPRERAILDNSPLQYIHQASLLDLLPQLFDEIRVPVAVVEELAAGRARGIQVPEIEELSWVLIEAHPIVLEPPRSSLGRGERAAIALARSLSPLPWVILDDRPARQQARSLRLAVTGTLGLLLRAKKLALLPAVGPVLDRLQELGFRLDRWTRAEVLRAAGEDQ